MVIQDPFRGLIDGVLQGHAIAQQLHQQSLQDELFERRKQQDAREAQLQDLDTQMRFTQYGRPVRPGSNVVEQSASGTEPDLVPGVRGQTYGTNYVRPVDKGRLLKAKLSDGRELQVEAYTPEEFSRRATETAMAGKVGEFTLQQQMADAVRQHQLRTEGRPAPAALVVRGLARPGELMLPKDILSTLAQIQTLEKPDIRDMAEGQSLVQVPKPSPFGLDAPDGGGQETTQRDDLGAEAPWTPPEPREAMGPTQDGKPLLLAPESSEVGPANPLAAAAAPGQQARADFVNRAKAAGQPTGQVTAIFTGKPKETNMTEDQLHWIAAHDPDQQRRADAKAAIEGIVRSKVASRPVTNDDALAQTVIANPSLYDNLTPSAKTRIAPLLSKQGFTEFGKPLGEAAITKIAESRSAIDSLKDLRQTLKDNEQYIGPVSGLQALNPYSDARQAQAKINLVRQRVGKALEGGVLRKEDEEKYKQILATLYDTPATAIAKVDNLLTTIERDIRTFEEQQRRGGRNVPREDDRIMGTGQAGGKAPPLPTTLTQADKGKTYINQAGKLIRVTDVNPENGKQFKFEEVKESK